LNSCKVKTNPWSWLIKRLIQVVSALFKRLIQVVSALLTSENLEKVLSIWSEGSSKASQNFCALSGKKCWMYWIKRRRYFNKTMKYHFESLNYLDNREIKEDHANGLGLHLCNYYPLGLGNHQPSRIGDFV
jgi:hypothetical protein